MRPEPGVFQDRRPPPLLQEPLRGSHDVRGGEGARGTPRGMQGLQLLRPGEDKPISPTVYIPNNIIIREITSFSGLPHDPDPPSPRGGHPRRGLRLLHLGDGD